MKNEIKGEGMEDKMKELFEELVSDEFYRKTIKEEMAKKIKSYITYDFEKVIESGIETFFDRNFKTEIDKQLTTLVPKMQKIIKSALNTGILNMAENIVLKFPVWDLKKLIQDSIEIKDR